MIEEFLLVTRIVGSVSGGAWKRVEQRREFGERVETGIRDAVAFAMFGQAVFGEHKVGAGGDAHV